MRNYSSLVIEPDINRRGRLKSAALAINSFRRIEQVSQLQEARVKFQADTKWDVMFIASELGETDICSFITKTKEQYPDMDCAIVTILKSPEQQSTLANIILSGGHGFLCEPYSVDRLAEIVGIVARVKEEGSQRRKKAAAAMLISTIIQEIDKLHLFISRGLNVEKAKRKLAEKCKTLQQFSDAESLQMYCDLAVDLFDKATPALAQNYSGASKRVKDRMEAKLREEYEKEFGKEQAAAEQAAAEQAASAAKQG